MILYHGQYFFGTEEALSAVLNSDTYLRLQNDNTHLYYQSPRYVYDFLEKELTAGKMG